MVLGPFGVCGHNHGIAHREYGTRCRPRAVEQRGEQGLNWTVQVRMCRKRGGLYSAIPAPCRARHASAQCNCARQVRPRVQLGDERRGSGPLPEGAGGEPHRVPRSNLFGRAEACAMLAPPAEFEGGTGMCRFPPWRRVPCVRFSRDSIKSALAQRASDFTFDTEYPEERFHWLSRFPHG